METLPVSKCIDILNVYCTHKNENLWVNRIVKEVNEATGSKDGPAIKRAIKLLKDGKILEIKKVNKQKELKILTPLGTEITDLFDNVDYIHKKFSSLQNEVKKYEKLMKADERGRRSLLLNSGWTKNDLNSFEQYNNTLDSVTELYIKNICNLLIYRFFKIISDFKVNEISKMILSRILSDELMKQFQIIAEAKSVAIVEENFDGFPEGFPEDQGLVEKIIFHRSHSVHGSLSSSFLDQLEGIFLYNFIPRNKIIQENIENLLKAMIYITNDNKNYIKFRQITCEKKFDPIYDREVRNTKIYEKNIFDLINLYDDILKNQTNNLKQKEKTYQLQESI